MNPFEIRDRCRQHLNDFVNDIYLYILKTENPEILDIGCGTGGTTLRIANQAPCNIVGVDSDTNALDYFEEKIAKQKPIGHIELINKPVYEIDFPGEYFDIIIAEGIFNIIGFKNGFGFAIPFLKPGGYFIIHDEYSDWEKKVQYLKKYNCDLIREITLSQEVWEKNYINCLKTAIREIGKKNDANLKTQKLLQKLKHETACFDKNPEAFHSRCYALRKNA